MTNLRYDFIIWDFHGTMTDNQLRSIRAYSVTGRKILGEKFPKELYQDMLTRPAHQLRDQIGVTHEVYIRQMLREYPSSVVESFLAEFHAAMDETYISIPGTKQVVKTLQEWKVKQAVFTNKADTENQCRKLREWGLPFLAERIYSPKDSGTKNRTQMR